MTCNDCNGYIHPERAEMGFTYCVKCAEQHPERARPEFGVLGVHKSTPIVVSFYSAEWQSNQSFMVR